MNMRFLKISTFIIAAGAILLLYFFVEPKNGILPKCIFHEITGLYCPGCGVQRSLHALLHGHILTAMNYNLLFILLLPLIIFFIFNFIRDKKYSQSSFIYRSGFSLTLAVIVICFWIFRNIPIAPFSWLAP
jgi:hypothetical protein